MNFKKWLQSLGCREKGESQADQLFCKVLKYLKYSSTDVSISWDIPECDRLLFRIRHNDFWFVGYLQIGL